MNKERRFLAGMLLGGLILLCACSENAGSPAASSAAATSLMIRTTPEDWEFHLRQYPPNILVVDYWATWCTPCIERFPSMVEMSERYADQGVTFVSFNLDELEDPFTAARAEDFLQAMQADFDHYATAINVFDTLAYLGLQSIPAVSIYDRGGFEVQRLTGDNLENLEELFDEADIEAAIAELLAEQPLI